MDFEWSSGLYYGNTSEVIFRYFGLILYVPYVTYEKLCDLKTHGERGEEQFKLSRLKNK